MLRDAISDMTGKKYGKTTLLYILSSLVITMFCIVLFVLILSAGSVYGQNNAEMYLTIMLIVYLALVAIIYLSYVYVTYVRLKYARCKTWLILFSFIGLHIIPFLVAIIKSDN